MKPHGNRPAMDRGDLRICGWIIIGLGLVGVVLSLATLVLAVSSHRLTLQPFAPLVIGTSVILLGLRFTLPPERASLAKRLAVASILLAIVGLLISIRGLVILLKE